MRAFTTKEFLFLQQQVEHLHRLLGSLAFPAEGTRHAALDKVGLDTLRSARQASVRLKGCMDLKAIQPNHRKKKPAGRARVTGP
jgi:hypothetical protein